jgi:hypothetical protein
MRHIVSHVLYEGYHFEEPPAEFCGDEHEDDFGEAPPVPVLWILTQHNPDFSPPFGTLACILDD